MMNRYAIINYILVLRGRLFDNFKLIHVISISSSIYCIQNFGTYKRPDFFALPYSSSDYELPRITGYFDVFYLN